MTPEPIARSRKAAIKESAAMELAELRDTLKVTQVDLAERMKVSQAAISKVENRIETSTLISFDQSSPRWAET